MRNTLIAAGVFATAGLLALGGPAAAQGFGRVTIGTLPPSPTASAAKPGGNQVEGVTVTGKKQAEADKDPNEVLCHSEPVLGSLFPAKVCATRRELSERRRNDQEVARKFEDENVDGAGKTH
jgi:hypothetical protein